MSSTTSTQERQSALIDLAKSHLPPILPGLQFDIAYQGHAPVPVFPLGFFEHPFSEAQLQRMLEDYLNLASDWRPRCQGGHEQMALAQCIVSVCNQAIPMLNIMLEAHQYRTVWQKLADMLRDLRWVNWTERRQNAAEASLNGSSHLLRQAFLDQ